ncbi:MAG: hypothetical protein FWH38_05290 [Treponema sp.]|nr:hypothetical protein [Treponema sp.]
MVKKRLFCLGVCLLSLMCLLSCGLEVFYYIGYIPDSNYVDISNASVQLPSSGTEGYSSYFTHFEIFYRIYISDMLQTGKIEAQQLSSINPRLNTDYSSLYGLTNKTSTSDPPTNLENTFSYRKYYKLALEGADINNILAGGSLGGTLVFDFDQNPGVRPRMILNGTPYVLHRANVGSGIGDFEPQPNRYFNNHPDLCNTANITDKLNADTETNSKSNLEYTYVSMYIAAIGADFITTIYSQPTFIGIFMLPNSS